MPFVNVKLVDGVFTPEEKHAMAKALTDVMVKFEGSEAFREVVWVLIEELHTDGWHIGGRPFEGPKFLMTTLSKSKDIVETIDGNPTTRKRMGRGRTSHWLTAQRSQPSEYGRRLARPPPAKSHPAKKRDRP